MHLLKDFLPPIVTRRIQNFKNKKKIYDSFNETKEHCKTEGYASEKIAEIVYTKTLSYRDSLSQNKVHSLSITEAFLIAAIAKMNLKRIRVLDLGGALGTHYFVAKRFFPDTHFEWVIVEMPSMVNKGELLGESDLVFKTLEQVNDIENKAFDLALTSATLQHLPDPSAGLQFLLGFEPLSLLFLRCGFTLEANQFWAIHHARYQDNGPGNKIIDYGSEVVDFPFALLSKSCFERELSKQYEEIMSMQDNSSVLVVQGKETIGMNRFYRKK